MMLEMTRESFFEASKINKKKVNFSNDNDEKKKRKLSDDVI